MNKHTPGPWAAHYHDSTDTYTIHVAGRNWDAWAVAEVGHCKEDSSNARLIAAAPDMLLALLRATAALEFVSYSDASISSAIALARAAIAKATGEA